MEHTELSVEEQAIKLTEDWDKALARYNAITARLKRLEACKNGIFMAEYNPLQAERGRLIAELDEKQRQLNSLAKRRK